MKKEIFPRYVVMLDNFGHDTNGNPIACHTVFGYRTAGADIKHPSAELYVTRRRLQVGYSNKRNCSAGDALSKAGAPDGLTLTRVEGERSEGSMYLIYDNPTMEQAS